MIVEFSDFIACDLQAISRWISRENPAAARRLLDSFRDGYRLLAQFPHAGALRKEFKPEAVRSLPISRFDKYLILYRVHPDRVEIWRVVHGTRDLRKIASEMR